MKTVVADPTISTNNTERLRLLQAYAAKPIRQFVQLDHFGEDGHGESEIYGCMTTELRNTDCLRVHVPVGWPKDQVAKDIGELVDFFQDLDLTDYPRKTDNQRITAGKLERVLLDSLADVQQMASALRSFVDGTKRDDFGFVVGTLGLCLSRLRELLRDELPF